MRAPLAQSLFEIVEGPFQDTGPKVFDLVSFFPFFRNYFNSSVNYIYS